MTRRTEQEARRAMAETSRERFLARLSKHYPLQFDPAIPMKRRAKPTLPLYGPNTDVWEALDALLSMIEYLEERDDD